MSNSAAESCGLGRSRCDAVTTGRLVTPSEVLISGTAAQSDVGPPQRIHTSAAQHARMLMLTGSYKNGASPYKSIDRVELRRSNAGATELSHRGRPSLLPPNARAPNDHAKRERHEQHPEGVLPETPPPRRLSDLIGGEQRPRRLIVHIERRHAVAS